MGLAVSYDQDSHEKQPVPHVPTGPNVCFPDEGGDSRKMALKVWKHQKIKWLKVENVGSLLTGVSAHCSQEEKIAVRKLLLLEVQHIPCVICLVDSWQSLNGLVRIFNAASTTGYIMTTMSRLIVKRGPPPWSYWCYSDSPSYHAS